MEDDHVVAAAPEAAQPGEDLRRIFEEIGYDHHHAPAADGVGDLPEGPAEIGARPASIAVGEGEDPLQVHRLAPGGEGLPHLVVEEHEGGGVLLVDDEVGDGGGHGGGVVGLGEGVLRGRLVAHGGGDVEADRRDEVGLLLVLLHVEAVGLAVDLPVEVAEVVPGGVLPVLRELDGEAAVGAPVAPGHEPLDDQTGPEVEPSYAVEDLRVQEPAGVFHRSGWGSGARGPYRGAAR